MAVSSPGGAGNASDLILPPDQTPLHSAPPRSPHAFQAMSNDGSPSPSRTPTKEREYGTTPSSRRSGPASEDCSPLRAPIFPTTSPGQVDFESPGSGDAKLEDEDARIHQEESLSQSSWEQQQEGPSLCGERREQGSSTPVGLREDGPVSHQAQQQTHQEMEEHTRLWQ